MTEPGTSIEPAYAATMPAPQGGALPTGLEWQALERMANVLAESDVIPYRLKRKPADVAVILLAAREYGIPPLMALSKLPVVNGTPAPMGELMVALVLRAGHYIGADFRNPDGTVYGGGPLTREHYGEARYKRRDWDEREVLRFTLDEAVTAGLVTLTSEGKAEAYDDKNRPLPWMQYTPNMARWRAVANACRLAFADVLLGLSYLPEELGAMVDADGAPVLGEVVDQQPARPRQGTAGSLEQRTAQETADKLETFTGPVEVLDNVAAHADTNGYLRERVTFRGNAMSLEGAIAVAKADLANTVDGSVVEEQQTPEAAAQPAQEAPAPAPPAEEPQAPAPGPQNGAQPEPEEPPSSTTGPPAVEYARAALEEADPETLRGLWNMAAEGGALDANVIAVVGDDDLAAMDLTRHPGIEAGVLPLRGLLINVNAYVGRHGTAVRDLGEPAPASAPAVEEPPARDPWAEDAAAGWPTSQPAPQ